MRELGVQRKTIGDRGQRLVDHEARRDAEPWSQADFAGLAVLVVALLAALVWLVHPWYDPMIDGSIYISTARSLLAGEGYTYLGTPFHLRPPGFSLLLAPVLQVAGTNFHLVNLFVAGFGCASLVLLYVWVRPRLGAGLALLVCVTVGTNPVFLTLCNQVMSDIPGVFFVLASLLLARNSERNPSLANEIALGVCIAASAYVRVLGAMVIPAILVERALRHVRNPSSKTSHAQFALKQVAPLLITTLVLLAPWGIRNQVAVAAPPADQLLNYSYSTALFHYDFGDPSSPFVSASDWGTRILTRCNEIIAAVATRLQEKTPTLGHIAISTVVFALFLYGLIASPSVAGFFILFSLVITGSYFAFQDRLLLPVFVVLVPLVAMATHRLLSAILGKAGASVSVAVVLAAICVADFAPRAQWNEIEARHQRSSRIADSLRAALPADSRLATVRGFHLHAMLDQPVYSLRWGYRLGAGMAGIDAVIDRYGVNTLVFDSQSKLDSEYEPALVAKYGAPTAVGEVRVLRVRD